VLSLDLEENDYLYRIRKNSRIVYVSVLDGDIFPRDCRTDGDRVLSKLREIPEWEEEWKTLTVRRGFHGIDSTADEFMPHGLDLRQLNIPGAVFLNLLDLTTVSRISDRVSRVKYDGETWILKVARFRHEIPALQQEVWIYSTLTSTGFPLAPKFIGFVYEETEARIVGFLMEEIFGETADIHNLKDCVETVRLLHAFGIVHGDLNKYNLLMTEQGAKIFDFEASAAQGNVDPAAAEEEVKALASKLADESGIGKR
jgi:serine/threonine protein kinase